MGFLYFSDFYGSFLLPSFVSVGQEVHHEQTMKVFVLNYREECMLELILQKHFKQLSEIVLLFRFEINQKLIQEYIFQIIYLHSIFHRDRRFVAT